LFLDWLKHFLKFKSEDKVLLILDNHGSQLWSSQFLQWPRHTAYRTTSPRHSCVTATGPNTLYVPKKHNTTKMSKNGYIDIQPKLRIKFDFLQSVLKHTTIQPLCEQLSKVSCVQEHIVPDETHTSNTVCELHGIQ
jgi:hypothetical protein